MNRRARTGRTPVFRAVAVAAAVAVLGVVAFVVTAVVTDVATSTQDGHGSALAPGPTSSQPAGTPTSSPAAPPVIATSTGPFAAGPVRPPTNGAYLGAWVRPQSLTQPGRLAAVTAFQARLQRRLDIVNTYRRLDEDFFNSSELELARGGSTLMLSWAGGDTRSITLGHHDDLIRARAQAVRAFGKPILLRFRWEMDRPGLRASMWSPEDYIAAWKHVRTLFTAEGATNASWVWCPTAEGFTGGYAAPFYPGDAAVDWICADVYAGSKFSPMGELIGPFLRFAAAHPSKPAMIGEFGVAHAFTAEQRAWWLSDAATVIKANPQLRAVLYFESDPLDNKGANQRFQLSDDPTALAAFQKLAREPYFNPPRVSLKHVNPPHR